jgi:hypothetical protein
MRHEFSAQLTPEAIGRPHAKVRPDYASRAHADDRTRHRREVAWTALSFIALVLCWDLSARLDGRVPGGEVAASAATAHAAEVARKSGVPRRLRKLSEETENEAPRNVESIK